MAKFKLNRQGVRELMKSPEMQVVLNKKAQEVAKIANTSASGYVVDTYTGKTRANASVYAKTSKARKDNYKNNTLLKSLGSGVH